MEIQVRFPGGARVDADFEGFTIATDQPADDGAAGSAPAPFAIFLASLAACSGIYALRFCTQRGIPITGLSLVQRSVEDPVSHRVEKIQLTIGLPVGFPEKYRSAIVRAAEQCAVKKHLEHPPKIEIETVDAVTAPVHPISSAGGC